MKICGCSQTYVSIAGGGVHPIPFFSKMAEFSQLAENLEPWTNFRMLDYKL